MQNKSEKSTLLTSVLMSMFGPAVIAVGLLKGQIAVQARLYRAKTLVDICVSTVLLTVMILPGSMISYYLDFGGTIIVSIYLAWTGIKTIIERLKK